MAKDEIKENNKKDRIDKVELKNRKFFLKV